MKIIIGLGNPGIEYENTRHNLGFAALDALAKEWNFPGFKENKKFLALLSEGTVSGEKIILAKPETFMNASGGAVAKLANFHKCASKDLLIIHDELDLPWGEVRLARNRGSAGHKGVESVITALGTKDFWRIRIGIAKDVTGEAEKFVLEKIPKNELALAPQIMKKAVEAAQEYNRKK